jgi:putative hemolysin
MFKSFLCKLLGQKHFDDVYRNLVAPESAGHAFRNAADGFGLSIKMTTADKLKLPRSGPVVCIANHPTGLREGIALGAVFEGLRPDSRTLSHEWFQRFPKIAAAMFLVDPQSRCARARRAASGTLRNAAAHVRAGGMLTVYPAGEVARFDFQKRQVSDPEWRSGVARIVRKTRATVVPIHIEGRNSKLFYLLSAIHPRLGAALLMRETLAQQGNAMRVTVGDPIDHDRWNWDDGYAAVARAMRTTVERVGSSPVRSNDRLPVER